MFETFLNANRLEKKMTQCKVHGRHLGFRKRYCTIHVKSYVTWKINKII